MHKSPHHSKGCWYGPLLDCRLPCIVNMAISRFEVEREKVKPLMQCTTGKERLAWLCQGWMLSPSGDAMPIKHTTPGMRTELGVLPCRDSCGPWHPHSGPADLLR